MGRSRELAELASAYDGGSLGFRNRIINGDMRIDQRNAGASHTCAVGTITYGIDRWYVYAAGAALTGQRVTGTSTNKYAYKITGAASNNAFAFGQRIESANVWDLVNQNVTLSFQASAVGVTSLRVFISASNSADAFGGGVTAITNNTFTISSTTQTFSMTFNAGGLAGNGLQIEFATSSGLTSGQSIQIENVQLEAGSVATPFERRDYGRELQMCQRYYEVLNSQSDSGGAVIVYGANAWATWQFKVVKRVRPTLGGIYTGSIAGPSVEAVRADGTAGVFAGWGFNGTNYGPATASAEL